MSFRFLRLYISLLLISLATLFSTVAQTYAPLYWADNSVLANGKWVKIRVDSTGMQELTHEQLRTIGFQQPGKVTVWGYSGAMLNSDRFRTDIPDDLPQTPAIHIGDKLIFFGENHIHIEFDSHGRPTHTINPYTSAGYYFLTDCLNPMNPPVADTPTPTYDSITNVHTTVAVIERELSNPTKSGALWFDTPLTQQNPSTKYIINKNGIADGAPVHIIYSWAKESGNPQSVELSVDSPVSIEGTTVSKQSATKRFTWQTDSVYIGGTGGTSDDITLTFSLEAPIQNDFTAIDWLRTSYTAYNNLHGRAQMLMYIPPNSCDALKMEMPTNAQLWDITDYAPTVLPPAGNGVYSIGKSSQTRTLVAFNPELLLYTPHIVGDVPPQNLHAMDVPEFVIISAPGLVDAAEELAALHRSAQNMKVVVATTQQVCNEYGSGSLSAYSIRRMLKHLSDKSPGQLRYVLLYGAGSYDNRSMSPKYSVPTYQCHNRNYIADEKLTYCTDAYYVMLGDTFTAETAHKTKPTVAVGRIPTDNIDKARSYTGKVRSFISSAEAPAFHNTILLSCDLGDRGEHSNFSEKHATEFIQQVPQGIVHKVYSDMFPANLTPSDSPQARQRLLNYMFQGVGIFNYIGHGNPTSIVSLEGSEWFTIQHLAMLKNRHPFLAFLSTCSSSSFDVYSTNIASEMLLMAQGGAIATIGNTRTAVSTYNNVLNSVFIKNYASLSPGATYGDLWLSTVSETLDYYSLSNNASINTIGYVLFGDPALQIPVPEKKISVETSTTKVVPLQKFTVKGSTGDTGFNGKATINICADTTIVRLLGRHEASEAGKPIPLNDRLLYSAATPVTDGQFCHTVQLPESAFTDTITHANIYVQAQSDSASEIYNLRPSTVVSDACRVQLIPSPAVTDDWQPACISEFLIAGDPDRQMLPVDCPVVLSATIDGGSTGLNLAQTSLAQGCSLHIDSQLKTDAILTPAGNGSWQLDYTVPSLADGRHSATLSVADNAGNTASRTLTFMIQNNDATIQLSSPTGVARDNIEFSISSSLATAEQMRLIITDTDGNTVKSTVLPPDQTATEWNLRDSEGNTVAPGRYKAFIQTTDKRLYSASDPVSFVVLP